MILGCHDDAIKWKHFPSHWPFVRGIHRSPVNSPHKGQWCGALMFSLICSWINGWVNKRKAGDLRCHHAHYDVTVMAYEPNSFASLNLHCLFWNEYDLFNTNYTVLVTYKKNSVRWWYQFSYILYNIHWIRCVTYSFIWRPSQYQGILPV